VNVDGWAVDGSGNRLRSPDGEFLPRAPRTRICEEWTNEQYGLDAVMEGAWYRCCSGQVRKLVDCCSFSKKRINGDATLKKYDIKVEYFDNTEGATMKLYWATSSLAKQIVPGSAFTTA